MEAKGNHFYFEVGEEALEGILASRGKSYLFILGFRNLHGRITVLSLVQEHEGSRFQGADE